MRDFIGFALLIFVAGCGSSKTTSSNPPASLCGNNAIDGAEECDDGNQTNGDGCTAACTNEGAPACGDGILQAGEACDDGANNSDTAPDACRTTCATASCGDGAVDTGEDCDLGGGNSDILPDTCRTSCLAPGCGDGVADTGETCDDGNATDTDACPDGAGGTCQTASCGDGFVHAGVEACDDQNPDDTDACLSTCAAAACGDGFIHTGVETCDDGNGILTDACPDGATGSCQAATCGDRFVQQGVEACDDGNNNPNDGCDACSIPATCGNGTPDAGEQCDNGAANSDTADGACRTTCRDAGCGDFVVDYSLGEECDDGNGANGDGCDNTCRVEVTAACGDGTLDPAAGEECDDGNIANGDGCSGPCQLETAGATCGGNTVDAGELCDDNNLVNGDYCNPTCNFHNLTTVFADVTAPCPSTGTLTSDNTYLWIACNNNGPPASGQILRIDIDDCLTNANCTPTSVTGPGPMEAITSDGRRLWVASGQQIIEYDGVTLAPVAGSGAACAPCSAADGPAMTVEFDDLRGLTYYGGFVYLVDANMDVLRRFDPAAKQVVTLAGSAYQRADTDGYGAAARFESPRYMATDNSGMLYIADNLGCAIRSYNTRTGYVGTFAGIPGEPSTTGGVCSYTDGTGTQAGVHRPRGMTSDGTSLYWVEFNRHTVRQGVFAGGAVSTMVGNFNVPANIDGIGCSGVGACPLPGANCYGTTSLCPASLSSPYAVAFHFLSKSLFVYSSGVIRRIE